jgi:cytochrome P450
VADIRVPAGTLIFGALRSDPMRDDYFANAGSFEPERWLRGESGREAGAANRVSMPFGAGPRVCPGRHLAILEMKIALATLLRHFEVESVDTVVGGEPDEIMSFTMTPSGLAMRLRERKTDGLH